jgi:GTP cyclohydrolase II
MLKQATAKSNAMTRRAGQPHQVNRAIADLRRGAAVLLRDGDAMALIQAAETIDDVSLAANRDLTGTSPMLVTTGRRAAALDLAPRDAAITGIVELILPPEASADLLNELADPTMTRRAPSAPLGARPAGPSGLAAAAIELAKLSRLLPAMALFPLPARDGAALARRGGLIEISTAMVFDHRGVLARNLRQVADARVPLADAENTRIVAFRPDDGGTDHLAIIIGEPRPDEPALVRIHSECFTGDLLSSLRCDCGEQLRGAIRACSEAGAGIVIYLAQEGRGIGLVNKLRAYRLQDAGFDTVAANEQLGFDADERIYQPAAEILRQLGFARVRLLTNNPDKVAALAAHGINVVERVPHVFAANNHNRAYLATKASKSGHLF